MTIKKKTFSATVEKDGGGLGPRQVKVLASNSRKDRVNDVLVPSGCKTSGSVVILADHEASLANVIGRGAVTVKSTGVEVVITFLDEGVSELADLACKLYKAGVVTDVSVGFDPIDYDYDKSTGGYLFKTWELLELSCVVIGCNPDAKVTAKARGTLSSAEQRTMELEELKQARIEAFDFDALVKHHNADPALIARIKALQSPQKAEPPIESTAAAIFHARNHWQLAQAQRAHDEWAAKALRR